MGVFQKKGPAETALPPWCDPLGEDMRKQFFFVREDEDRSPKMACLIDEAVVPRLYQHQDPGNLGFTAHLFVT